MKKEHDETTIGGRINKARKLCNMSQMQLAKAVSNNGVAELTNQAVSNWEKNKNEPSRENFAKLASALGVRTEWLQFGQQPMRATSSSNITDVDATIGRCIPLISLEDFDVSKAVANIAPLRRAEVMTHYPCGEQARAFTLNDRSMEPRMNKGDIIVIDPDIKEVPGDFVVAKITLEKEVDIIIFAQYSFTKSGNVLIAPANHQFKSYEFSQAEFSENVEILGVMTERTEPRRQ